MQVALTPPKIDAAGVPLERLADNPRLSEADKLAEVSRQFEAVLLRQILQHAQRPVFQSDCNPDSSTHAIYRDLVTNQLAESISKSGTFGLASSLKQQLLRQLLPEQTGATAPADKP